MKKTFLAVALLLPSGAFAQMANSDNGFSSVLIILVICVVIFIICRELICWYYKINKMVSNQEEIIRLLRKIAKEDNDRSK